MRSVKEYQRHAKECRQLAATAAPRDRRAIMQMSEMWERLATERRAMLERAVSRKKNGKDKPKR